ncbi:histidine kinase [Larkinella knui]
MLEEPSSRFFSTHSLLWQLVALTVVMGFISDVNVVGWQPDLLVVLTLNSLLLSIVVFWVVIKPVKRLSDRWLSWRQAPYPKFMLTILLSGLGAVIVLWAELLGFVVLFDDPENEPSRNFHDLFFAFLITVIAAAIYNSSDLFAYWRHDLLRSERLEKEKALAQLEALKSQINPHFLFNTLNTLSSLTHQDPVRARECIQLLARVYRYVLENREVDQVPLKQEMQFLEAYLTLLQMRFGDSLQVSINRCEGPERQVPPLVVQMLVENAVKHNIISAKKPLYIHISTEQKTLIVRNSFQPKTDHTYSSGLGLANIETRYAYLSEEPVRIRRSADWFTVSVPLL